MTIINLYPANVENKVSY